MDFLSNESSSPSMQVNKKDNKKRPKRAKRMLCPVLIKSRRALILFTRLLFAVTVLTCTAVILASVWLILDCRGKLHQMRTVLEHNNKYCTNMGLQVMFACCVVLFAVFGLGCIGRQMTGYAMLIISGVAIFQSTMTLIFNECRTGVKDNFLTSIESSFKTCRLGSSTLPFELVNASMISPTVKESLDKMAGARSSGYRNKIKKNVREYKHMGVERTEKTKIKSKASTGEKQPDTLFKRDKKNDDLLIVEILDDLVLSKEYLLKSLKGSCEKESLYATVLSLFLPKQDVIRCVKLCELYQDSCVRGRHDNHSDTKSAVNLTSEMAKSNKSHHNNFNKDTHQNHSCIHKMKKQNSFKLQDSKFEDATKSCGVRMWGKVRKFCFYDNVIFMPLSLGGPLFYIFLSLGFMYLGHCDTHIKDSQVPADDFEHRTRHRTASNLSSLSSPAATGKVSLQAIGDVPTSGGSSEMMISQALSTPQLNIASEKTSLSASSTKKYDNYGHARANDLLVGGKPLAIRTLIHKPQPSSLTSTKYISLPSSVSSNSTLEQYISDANVP